MAALNRGDGDAKRAHNIPATISVDHHRRFRPRPRRPSQPDLLCDTLRGGTGTLVVAATVYRIAPDTALR
jgi:hypothetical protein